MAYENGVKEVTESTGSSKPRDASLTAIRSLPRTPPSRTGVAESVPKLEPDGTMFASINPLLTATISSISPLSWRSPEADC